MIEFLMRKLYLIIFIVGNIAMWTHQYHLYHENQNFLHNGKSAMCSNLYVDNRNGNDEYILACDYYNEDLQKTLRPWMQPRPNLDELKKLAKEKGSVKILYMTNKNINAMKNTQEKTYKQVIYELRLSTIIRNCLFMTFLYLIAGFMILFGLTHKKNKIEKEDYQLILNMFLGKSFNIGLK